MKSSSLYSLALLLGALIPSALHTSFSPDSAVAIKAAAEEDGPPKGVDAFSKDYLLLEGKYTDSAWIRNSFNDNFDRWENYSMSNSVRNKVQKSDIGKRNPIIFFNVNPSLDVSEIEEIGFEIAFKDGGTTYSTNSFEWVWQQKTHNITVPGIDGGYTTEISYNVIDDINVGDKKTVNVVKATDMHTMHFTEGNNHLFADNRDVTVTEFNFDTKGNYSSSTSIENKHVYKVNEFLFNIPAIGEVDVIQNIYSATNSIEKYASSIRDSAFFPYYNSGGNDGFTTYSLLNAGKLRNQNYSHYLILPIGKTGELDITYLSAKIRLSNGELVTPEIPFEEIPGIQENEKAIRFSKVAGNWTTSNAVYFPGERYYRAKSIVLESIAYKGGITKITPIVAYTGAIYGQGWIDYANLRKNTPLALGTTLSLNYEFQSRANGLIVDIPDDVLEAEILFIFEINPHDFGDIVGDPFYINLTDENGKLGIIGEMPLDEDPEKEKGFWDRIKAAWNNLFGNNTTANSVLTLIKAFAVVIGVLFLLVIFFKVVNFFSSLKTLLGKDKNSDNEL